MTTPAPQSLVAGSRRLLALLPAGTRRSLGLAGILAFLLAGLEFLALLLLYPVFGVLSQPGATDAPVSLFGVQFDRSWTRYLAMAALGLLVLRSILTLAYRRWWLGVAARAELRLSERLLRGFAYAPYRFHLSTVTTDLATQAVSHVGLACQTGLNGLVGVFSASLLSVGLGAALIVTNPLAGIAVTVYLTVLGLLYSLRTREWNRRLGGQLQSHIRLVYGRVHVLLRGIRELTIFGQRDDQLAQISAARARMVRTNMQVFLLQDIPKAALEVTLYTTVLVALSFMLSMANPDDALPLVALYVVAGLRIMPALAQLLGYVSSARTGLKVAGSVADTIEELEHTGAAPDAADGPDYPARAELTIRELTFRYEADLPPVIDRLSLRLPHGTFLGVVGPSGSGKTTFTSLVLGLLAPQQGAISYGGQPVVANDSRWFHKVAVVPQEVFLTDDSLRDNIRAGLPDDAERMAGVVATADLEPLVADLPQGLDTRLGEAGSRLSAGQRQRVGLARALYHDPEILVLDEPTSALDAATEARIVASLERLRGTRTIIAVAHRTATLTGSDQVLRLGADGVATVGAPATLLAGEPRA